VIPAFRRRLRRIRLVWEMAQAVSARVILLNITLYHIPARRYALPRSLFGELFSGL
jgi:hypothetical protein